MKLLDDDTLASSEIVANSRMNRERGAVGVNSYERELGLNPIDYLANRVALTGSASWLDLCCGRGRALIDAAIWFSARGEMQPVSLKGVDLVNGFDDVPVGVDFLKFEAATLLRWSTRESFDLITCVHGLHYLGDKLGAIERATQMLTSDGTFIANLDLTNLIRPDGFPLARSVLKRMRECGLTFNSRRHVLSRVGRQAVSLGFEFVGADDTAGPNYSGQEAVNSIYRTEC